MKINIFRLSALLFLLFVLPTLASPEYYPGQVRVKYKNDVKSGVLQSGHSGNTAPALSGIPGNYISYPYPEPRLLVELKKKPGISPNTISELENIYEYHYTGKADPALVAAKLSRLDEVEYAEPVYVRKLVDLPNDTLLPDQYYLPLIGALEAWDYIDSLEIADTALAAIVDTGVDVDHPDLKENLFFNPGEVGIDEQGNDKSANGIDDDENGFIDDYMGWDFVAGDSIIGQDNMPLPGNAHGTHCAGIVAATRNNTAGIAGTAINTKYLPVKIGYDSPWSNSVTNSYQGVLYAGIIGCDIISCSWGGTGFSRAEEAIINAVAESGALIVAAAGNDGENTSFFPASYDNVLSVAASNAYDALAGYSNYGYTVDITAPGSDIMSAVPGDRYRNMSGTSMATPVAAAAAAMLKTLNPDKSPAYIGELLKSGAIDIDTNLLQDQINKIGSGRLNILNSINAENPQSIIVENIKVSDRDGDSYFRPGDTLDIYFDLKNELSPLTNLRIYGKEADNIKMGLQFFGNMLSVDVLPSAGKVENIGPISFRVPEIAMYNHEIDIALNVFSLDDDFSFKTGKTIVLNPSYLTLDENRLSATFTSNGRIAYNDYPRNLQGDGFTDPNGNDLLFEGAFMIALDTNRVSDCARTGGEASNDFWLKSAIRETISGDTVFAKTLFTDSLFGLMPDEYPGYKIEQSIRQIKSNNPDTDFLNETFFISYDIINISEYTDSFYGGYYFDWDLGSEATNDICIFNERYSYGMMLDTEEEGVYAVGVKMLSDMPLNFYAMENDGESEDNIGVYDDYTDAEKFKTLSGGIARKITGIEDVSMVIGGGPAIFRRGDTLRMSFAIFTAPDTNRLNIRAEQIEDYSETLALNFGKKDFFIESVFPNPVSAGEQIRIIWNAEEEGTAQAVLYDGAGRKIILENAGRKMPGRHTGSYNIPEVSAGAYRLGIEINGTGIYKSVIIE